MTDQGGNAGMNPMDMLKQVQEMQIYMQAAQEALASTTIDATVGGGVVRATVTGEGELRDIKIDPSVVDPDDIETLEDLVVAAVTEATRQAKELQAQKLGGVTGGLDLNSLLGGPGGPRNP
ncbi:MAG: DNA-binding protein YbaB/EbfC family [Actinomycetia bacterium]|jgi:DNA-binding YbaB/EbfC family protein|nr:DNA-binding protein YbaB/EbfC family [Actinomycetes bacterium]